MTPSEILIASFTLMLVIVGVLQWCLIRRQDQHFTMSERAWVLASLEWDTSKWADGKGRVFEGSGTGGDTTAIYAVLSCRNEGNSPAWIEEKRAKFEIVSVLPPKPNLESAEFIQIGPEPIGVGNALPHTNQIAWQPEATGHVALGNMMVIYGVVKYRDIFDKLHETTFGYKITPNRELVRLEGMREYNKHT
jgi:hypothetical protein